MQLPKLLMAVCGLVIFIMLLTLLMTDSVYHAIKYRKLCTLINEFVNKFYH